MKQFILYLFILLPFCVNSQVNETFDGPMLGADWIGKDRGPTGSAKTEGSL